MTMYNMAQMGNPLYLQLWFRDADEPEYSEVILDIWDKYGSLSLRDFRAQLNEQGKFIEINTEPISEETPAAILELRKETERARE